MILLISSIFVFIGLTFGSLLLSYNSIFYSLNIGNSNYLQSSILMKASNEYHSKLIFENNDFNSNIIIGYIPPNSNLYLGSYKIEKSNLLNINFQSKMISGIMLNIVGIKNDFSFKKLLLKEDNQIIINLSNEEIDFNVYNLEDSWIRFELYLDGNTILKTIENNGINKKLIHIYNSFYINDLFYEKDIIFENNIN